MAQISPSYLNRSRQIATALSRYGFGSFASMVGVDRLITSRFGFLARKGDRRSDAPVRLRKLLEELGTTFIKLGQILSTRSDLLDSQYQIELAKLQDDVKRVDPDTIKSLVESELGMTVAEAYSKFDYTPLAAASIGQVHAAELHDGTEVVVKVRRPNVVRQVEIDLQILRDIGVNASRVWPNAQNYDLTAVIEDFGLNLRLELDYRNEARNLAQMAKNFSDDDMIRFPAVFAEFTRSGVLTMERLSGAKVNDKSALIDAGIDTKQLAERAARAILKMIFEDGFYHADPHPGNFFVEETGCIALIDLGMVGVIDDYTQDQLIDLLIAVASKDTERLIDTFEDLGMTPGGVDRIGLRVELARLLVSYRGSALGDIAIGELISDIMRMFRKYKMQLPGHHANLLKMMLMVEGLGKTLDPEFDIGNMIEPYATKLVELRYGPNRQERRALRAAQDMEWLGSEGPRHARRILLDVERTGFKVNIQERDLNGIYLRIERVGAWITLGVTLSGLLVAMAILISADSSAGWEFTPRAFFSASFVAVIAIGSVLITSLFLARRRY